MHNHKGRVVAALAAAAAAAGAAGPTVHAARDRCALGDPTDPPAGCDRQPRHHAAHHGRTVRSGRILPFCSDGDAAHVTLADACERDIKGAAQGLCVGLLRMQRASCRELGDRDFLVSMVGMVGLKPDQRAETLYGNFSSKMATWVHGKSARDKVGLWQNPVQLAEAMIHVGSSARVKRYIEVGVFTAWTCCFISAYLRRVGPIGAFQGRCVVAARRARALSPAC